MCRQTPRRCGPIRATCNELFGGRISSEEDARKQVAGKIFITEGFGNPALTSLVEEWGAVGLIACNPGVDIHWGTCTTIWGTPDLDDMRAQAEDSRGRGQQGRPARP